MAKSPRVLFVHYRSGERDGVSLEMEKRANLCQAMGAEVFFLSGYDGLGRDNAKTIPLIDLRASYNTFLRENAFYHKLFDETTMLFIYAQLENKFVARLDKYLTQLKPDLIFVHNVFSHAYNLPFSTALLKVLDRYQFPTIAVNHDFWFDRNQFLHPKYPFVKTILEAIPPNRPYILSHQTINSRASRAVHARRGIITSTIGDYFDFNQPVPAKNGLANTMLPELDINPDNLIILHATRITERKAIELAISYAHILQKHLLRLSAPFKLGHKAISSQTKITLLFPNFVEVDALGYWHMLKNYAAHLEVDVVWAYDRFSLHKSGGDGVSTFSYWDSYHCADLVTYTSIVEGFGNQFLEAIYYHKLPIVFEYPVFLDDIKPEGYRYISLGKRTRKYGDRRVVPPSVLDRAASQTILYLQDPAKLSSLTRVNFELGRTHHNTNELRSDLQKILSSL